VKDVTRLRETMVDGLVSAGRLHSPSWIDAFARVPRHPFVREFFRQTQDLSGWEPVSATDPGAMAMIYSDTTWVTQLDNDPDRWHAARSSGEPAHGTPSSSSTAPGLMAAMLEALEVRDEHRMLEIGTGSGYTAALLSNRLTSSLVASVEVDPVVAETARTALRACGFDPTVAVADGAAGHAAGGPYDRLIATCSVPDIPAAWIAQVRQDGMILASLHRDLGGGPLVLLRVDGPGHAEGRFLPTYGSFMSVRTSPPPNPAARLATALATEPAGAAARAAVIPAEVLDSKDFGMIAALRLPGVASIGFDPDTGPQRWLLADDGSWARFDELTGTVFQHGARRLWDEVEDVHDQWVQLGRPARGRIGLTVTDIGEHRFWVDNRHGVWWTQGQAVSRRCRTGG